MDLIGLLILRNGLKDLSFFSLDFGRDSPFSLLLSPVAEAFFYVVKKTSPVFRSTEPVLAPFPPPTVS